jgi:hypothetical protein
MGAMIVCLARVGAQKLQAGTCPVRDGYEIAPKHNSFRRLPAILHCKRIDIQPVRLMFRRVTVRLNHSTVRLALVSRYPVIRRK